MKALEVRKKEKRELEELLAEKREKLRELYFDLAAGKVKDIKEIRETRRDIARILTVLNEKKAGEKTETEKKNNKK